MNETNCCTTILIKVYIIGLENLKSLIQTNFLGMLQLANSKTNWIWLVRIQAASELRQLAKSEFENPHSKRRLIFGLSKLHLSTLIQQERTASRLYCSDTRIGFQSY
jgi:hypothetical protein